MMDRFVGVRIVQANGMDLSLFQFDFDLTFAVFYMNADKTIYGRYGTRSSRKDALKDMSLEGFRKATAAALEIHAGFPANKASLARKRGPKPKQRVPEDYPTLGKYKAKLDFSSKNVVKSCMHCHQILDAERKIFRSDNKPIPDHVMFPWPMPDVVGLSLDRDEKARVRSVAPDSIAARGGFRPGDDIVSLDGQPIVSIADVQWVLHNKKDPDTAEAEISRDGSKKKLTLQLTRGWRRAGDITWRVSTWDIRRMGTGGLVLREMSANDRRRLKIDNDSLGLRVEGMGRYPPHNVAQRAGFKKEDIIVEFDGKSDDMRISELLAYTMQERKSGDTVDVVVLRKGKRVQLKLRMQ